MIRREFIQYLYEEKLKDELKDMRYRSNLYRKTRSFGTLNPQLRKRLILLTVNTTRWSVSSVVVRLPLILHPARSSWGHCRARLRRHNSYPCHISKLHEDDDPASGRMGSIRHSQIPKSVTTVSWNRASRSKQLKRIAPEKPYERFEARPPPKPAIPFRRNGTRLVDSEDEDE